MRLELILEQRVKQIIPLHGGMIGEVYQATLEKGERIVVKVASSNKTLDIEGYMLIYLKEHSTLPVPEVLYHAPDLLIMTFIEGQSAFNTAAQEHAAELLAALHQVTAPNYGLERDTLIGGLHQPNPPTNSWLEFFRDSRLLYMADVAYKAGRLPVEFLPRIEKLASCLPTWLDEPDQPALLHGDVWTTNVLAKNNCISAFLDPAIYYGHPEIELAFITLFNTFDRPFFERYHEIYPFSPAFWERRDIYNLYPLLVHVRLFGGGYVASVDRILRKYGF
ncbi:MAG: fructosamine kinase [Chloroflexi bacterium]|nr:MAG: fructosamine kinase [Chloroflexota bacterium]